MIWKFPSRFPPVYMEGINPETMQEVAEDQIKSTYQSDYTGIPQGILNEKIELLTFTLGIKIIILFLHPSMDLNVFKTVDT